MIRVPIFRIELDLPDGRKFAGAFTVSPKRGPGYDFQRDAVYQFTKKLEAMMRVADGMPRPGDIDPDFPVSLAEVKT